MLQIAPPSPVLFPTVNLGAVLVAICWFLTVGLAVYLTYLQARKGRQGQLQEEASGWERLAKLRSEEIASLSRRMTELEARITTMSGENTDLRSLNLQLQRENKELRDQVDSLQRRIDHLEHPSPSSHSL